MRNEHIRGTAKGGQFETKYKDAGLRWFGHVQMSDSDYVGRKMLKV